MNYITYLAKRRFDSKVVCGVVVSRPLTVNLSVCGIYSSNLVRAILLVLNVSVTRVACMLTATRTSVTVQGVSTESTQIMQTTHTATNKDCLK